MLHCTCEIGHISFGVVVMARDEKPHHFKAHIDIWILNMRCYGIMNEFQSSPPSYFLGREHNQWTDFQRTAVVRPSKISFDTNIGSLIVFRPAFCLRNGSLIGISCQTLYRSVDFFLEVSI